MSISCTLFVCIPLSKPKIYYEVDEAESGQKPKVVIKMTPIEIVWDPTHASIGSGDFCHN